MKTNKLIINFTPTGMIPTKKMNPYVPIFPEEIIKEVLNLRQYNISMVHLHARDKDGFSTYRKEIYKEIIEGIRQEDKDLILCVSTSGRDFVEVEKRSEVLDLEGIAKPDMASLTLSSLNFNKIASINTPDMIKSLAEKMKVKGIKPELEIFDLGMINYAKYLYKKELIAPPFYFNLILGNIACAQANLLTLGTLINELPENSIYSIGGIGNFQLKMNVFGLVNNAGIRIGLEDNIWFDNARTELATNEKLLLRIDNIARSLNLEIATPKEVRKLLALPCLEEKEVLY